MNNSTLTLFEFSMATGLTLEQLARMLASGRLPFVTSPDGNLLVDTGRIEINSLAQAAVEANSAQVSGEQVLHPRATELIASTLLDQLEPIIEEAVGLALQWLQDDSDDESPSE